MVRADALQLRFIGPIIELLFPGSKAMSIIEGHIKHLQKELDYKNEAGNQRRFARYWGSHPNIHIPKVLWSSPTVLVTQWSDNIPLRDVINSAPDSPLYSIRSLAGENLLNFTLSNPGALGLVHGDPHPGNFRISSDGKILTVLDFGAVAQEDGFTELFALAALAMHHNEPAAINYAHQCWSQKGWLDPKVSVEDFIKLLTSDTKPHAEDCFTFSGDWVNQEASKWLSPSAGLEDIQQVKMPPAALLEHRALTGNIALCCQLKSNIPLENY